MQNLGKMIGLICALSWLSACSNSNGYNYDRPANGGSDGFGTGSISGGTIEQGDLGGDPNAPGYFAQANADRVFFAVDQSTLSQEARRILEGQAAWLANNQSYSAVIEGHADEQGTREYNLALGARRANAAREYLISQGVAGNRLRIVSFGKERPVELCSIESCYQKNRRAVTVLANSLGS